MRGEAKMATEWVINIPLQTKYPIAIYHKIQISGFKQKVLRNCIGKDLYLFVPYISFHVEPSFIIK